MELGRVPRLPTPGKHGAPQDLKFAFLSRVVACPFHLFHLLDFAPRPLGVFESAHFVL